MAMVGASPILSVILALAAATATPKSAPVDIFPEKLIFEARVLRVSPSEWKAGPRNTRTRTVQVEFRIDQALKGEARQPAEARTQTATIAETSKAWGRLEGGGGVWGDADFAAGDTYLIFGNGADPAAVFSQPTAAYLKRANPAFAEDVEWIIEGEKLDPAAQASRLLGLLGKSPNAHTLFVGRYLAAVAHAVAGPSRSAMLDAISRVESLKLDEDARAELLRALHIGLVMQDKPSADEVQALLAGSLETLAAARAPEAGEVPARVESVAQVYLPWLAKRVSRFPSAVLPLVAKDQRERVSETARSLAALERLSPESRDVLRQLANALR